MFSFPEIFSDENVGVLYFLHTRYMLKGRPNVIPIGATKACGGSDDIAPLFLTSALDAGEFSALRFGHFAPGERDPVSQWIGGWLGTRADLYVSEKREILSPCRDSNPG